MLLASGAALQTAGANKVSSLYRFGKMSDLKGSFLAISIMLQLPLIACHSWKRVQNGPRSAPSLGTWPNRSSNTGPMAIVLRIRNSVNRLLVLFGFLLVCLDKWCGCPDDVLLLFLCRVAVKRSSVSSFSNPSANRLQELPCEFNRTVFPVLTPSY